MTYSEPYLYFVTLCTHQAQCLFGTITNFQMIPNALGQFVLQEWAALSRDGFTARFDEHVLMPNHLHAIVELCANVDPEPLSYPNRTWRRPANNTLAEIIRRFKARITHRARALTEFAQISIWQRGYHEHVIRNDLSLEAIREYIRNNPAKWQEDRYHTAYQASVRDKSRTNGRHK